MNKILSAAVFAASMAITSAASAAVIVFNSTTGTPSTAGAATPVDIAAGDFIFADVPTLGPSDEISFVFKAVGDILISPIAMTGNGFSEGADLALVTYGFDDTTPFTFDSITNVTPVSTGSGFLPGNFNLMDGETFSIFWKVGASTLPVGLRANFVVSNQSIPPVPLPAALPLLAGGIAMLGLFRRKSSNKA